VARKTFGLHPGRRLFGAGSSLTGCLFVAGEDEQRSWKIVEEGLKGKDARTWP
jgi:hypothetical protein